MPNEGKQIWMMIRIDGDMMLSMLEWRQCELESYKFVEGVKKMI